MIEYATFAQIDKLNLVLHKDFFELKINGVVHEIQREGEKKNMKETKKHRSSSQFKIATKTKSHQRKTYAYIVIKKFYTLHAREGIRRVAFQSSGMPDSSCSLILCNKFFV